MPCATATIVFNVVMAVITVDAQLPPQAYDFAQVAIAAKPADIDDKTANQLRADASAGKPVAQYFMGLLSFYGHPPQVPQSATAAHEYFRQAAAQGHHDSQTNLGVMLAGGHGVGRAQPHKNDDSRGTPP